MPDISSSLSKREVNARQNTYTKSEIDLKDGAIQAIAEAAQTTADAAEKKNQEQDQLIAELQKSSHSHSNQDVLDKIEQPYTTAERDKLAGLENYTHPTHTAHAKGFYKFASDGEGHITNAEKVTKKDITDLGVPGDDTNTTYKLALPTYTSQKEPPAPILSLIGSDGSENKQTIPCTYTALDDIVYKEFSGFKIGGKYQSVADLAFVIPRSARIYPWRITAYISLETPSGSTYIHLHYTLEITDEGSTIRRYQGNGKYYSGNSCATNDWAILSNLQNFSNPDRDVWLYRIGVPDRVFSKLTNARCEARLVYQTGKKGDVVKPVNYYTDITFDETVHAMDTNLVYVLTKADVSNVAFTGNYNDLSDKPAIPDISGKQDKSTAVTHSANTAVGSTTKPVYIAANGAATPISHSINADVPANAKFTDTTYSDATQSTHGLMTAADKKKLDGMDLSKYLPLHGTADQSKALSNGSMRYGWCVNNAANADSGYRWFRIGTLALSKLAFDTETMYLHVCSGYGKYGVLCVYTRIDSTGVGVQTIRLSWLNKSAGTLPPKFKLVGIGSSDGVKFELWCYTPSRWESVAYYVVADLKLTGGLLNRWLLEKHSDPDAKSATTVGTKSVTDVDLSYAAKANEAATLTDSGWQKPTFPSGVKSSSIRYRKQGKIVSVTGYVQFSAAQTTITVFTLPTGYRPPAKIQQFNAVDSSAQQSFLIKIDTDGKVGFFGKTRDFFATSFEYYMHCTFFVD